MIRLHVLANSDSAEDQALKLRVRDRVLAEAETYLTPGITREETEELLRAHLYDLAAAGAEAVGAAGCDYPVTASLVHNYWFPTKTYTDFALPAGQYTALRIEIGEGAGQNWWCVVFPPLCLGSVPGVPDHRRGPGLCGEIPGHRAAGGVQGLACGFVTPNSSASSSSSSPLSSPQPSWQTFPSTLALGAPL